MRVDNLNGLTPREQFALLLGQSFGGDRDIYDALGYKKELKFSDYWNKYQRDGLGSRIIKLFPENTWKNYPDINASNRRIENDFDRLKKDKDLFHYLERIDRLSRVGQYGLLFIGFDDLSATQDLSNPVNPRQINSLEDVLYFTPVSQGSVHDIEIDNDPSSARFKEPEQYLINFDSGQGGYTDVVHHSRVIHIAEDLDESEIYGTPALKNIYNQLYNLQKVTGSSAEAYWKQAVQNILFNIDKDVKLDSEEKDSIKEEVKKLEHSQKRYIHSQGMDAEVLESNMNSPRYTFDNVMKVIAGSTGIPKRVLTGSERGELASNQDIVTFYATIEARQIKHAEPKIIKPLFKKLQDYGAISNGDYDFEWQKLYTLTEVEESEIISNWAQSIAQLSKTYPDLLSKAEIRKEVFGFNAPNNEEMSNKIIHELRKEGENELANKLENTDDKWQFIQIIRSLNPFT